MTAAPRLRIGISRCLLGDEVRWDGRHKYEPELIRLLGSQVEWISVCPEVESGLPVPREPLRLERTRGADGSLRLMFIQSRVDWTNRMAHWAAGKLATLDHDGLDGFVLKSKSPTCGPANVPVVDEGGAAIDLSTGIWAQALAAQFPDLPVEDEERLRDPIVRQQFLSRVRAYADQRHRG